MHGFSFDTCIIEASKQQALAYFFFVTIITICNPDMFCVCFHALYHPDVFVIFSVLKMEFNNTKHNPKFKKSSSKESIICFKLREARGTNWLSFNDMKVYKVPSEIHERLLNLHHLYMSRCCLSGTLPVELGYLEKLKVLDISMNKITILPDNLFANLNSLEVLDVSGNMLRSLPYTLECCSELRELCSAQNQLVAVPHTLANLSNLQMLDLSENMIRQFQGEMFAGPIQNNLRVLRVNSNILDRLPREIGMLSKLQELDVSDNQLYFLPTTTRSLKQLQVLRFTGNKWTNPSPQYCDKYKGKDDLDGSYGLKAKTKLSTLVYPVV